MPEFVRFIRFLLFCVQQAGAGMTKTGIIKAVEL
jgi:hypothetical protein